MSKRFVSIWFRFLTTDWFTRRDPALAKKPFVLAAPDHGRMVITAVNALALSQNVDIDMVVADARALIPGLEVLDDKPGLTLKLLKGIAEWCTRYTPVAGIDAPDGIILDASGCPHLWGGEKNYIHDIITRLQNLGYHTQAAMADTIGTAWAMARYGKNASIIPAGAHGAVLLSLPPAALRIERETVERLYKLGLREIKDFIAMPRSALRRRFGQQFLERIDQALGNKEEIILPVLPVEAYQERLPCLEPIVTPTGIEIALERLLDKLCNRLIQEQKGLRIAVLKGYRVDGKIECISVSTNHPTHNKEHLSKLFALKFSSFEPALGIEVFILEAQKVEEQIALQEKLWSATQGLNDSSLSEMLDRLVCRFGEGHIHRYLPDEHYWPERSVKPASSLTEKKQSEWKVDRPRPLQLLPRPEPIQVTAPVPDYPPMLFHYKGILHKITKADGPERIEQEWWLQEGQHRDYYTVEDETGRRYWLFRSGHYASDKLHGWFLHGFFA
jgi:protein ImuB